MASSFDKLRKTVFGELEKQRAVAEADSPSDQARLFGSYVDVCRANLSISRSVFARALDIERELADAILDGLLPVSEIDDEFLVEIAQVIQYEPNLLRTMLGRETKPADREGQVR